MRSRKIQLMSLLNVLILLTALLSCSAWANEAVSRLFAKQSLTQDDSILVVNAAGTPIYQWQSDKLLIPASLVKLATSYAAIQKWGLNKRFETDFYRTEDTLLVKGYGDPFLVSEEIELLAQALKTKTEVASVTEIKVDASYFLDQPVPGRSKVVDPYNAPLAAVSANFNTAKLTNRAGTLSSAEAQTPLTSTAERIAKQLGRPKNGKTERVNLLDAQNAAVNFAEVLAAKLGLNNAEITLAPHDKPSEPKSTTPRLIYSHSNTRSLADVVRGTLEFSNNFIANQLFILLAEQPQATFKAAADKVSDQLSADFEWTDFKVVEGAGLSRGNRLSAKQLDDLLVSLSAHRGLFKPYKTVEAAKVRAKTGSLNGVHSFAGYISLGSQDYRFVFNFNRKVPYKYRETLLKKLVFALQTDQA